MLTIIATLFRDESGATAIEYGLIAALVSLGGVAALEEMSTGLAGMFSFASGKLNQAAGS